VDIILSDVSGTVGVIMIHGLARHCLPFSGELLLQNKLIFGQRYGYLFTNSMEQSSFRQDNSHSASLEISRLLWSPEVHYRVHNSMPLVRYLFIRELLLLLLLLLLLFLLLLLLLLLLLFLLLMLLLLLLRNNKNKNNNKA